MALRLVVTGVLESADFDTAAVAEGIDRDWSWYALYLALVLFVVLAQTRRSRRGDQANWS